MTKTCWNFSCSSVTWAIFFFFTELDHSPQSLEFLLTRRSFWIHCWMGDQFSVVLCDSRHNSHRRDTRHWVCSTTIFSTTSLSLARRPTKRAIKAWSVLQHAQTSVVSILPPWTSSRYWTDQKVRPGVFPEDVSRLERGIGGKLCHGSLFHSISMVSVRWMSKTTST